MKKIAKPTVGTYAPYFQNYINQVPEDGNLLTHLKDIQKETADLMLSLSEEKLAHLSCWIGLDDSTRENGCVHYVPGSHRWNLLPITGLADDMSSIQSVLTAEQRREFKPIAIELKKGEASFHHPLMVHGSFENKTDRPRRATVINVFRDGVMSDSDDHLLEGVPVIARGTPMQGQFFPLLFDPNKI